MDNLLPEAVVRKRLDAVEKAFAGYLEAGRNVDQYRAAARTLADIFDPTMLQEEQEAVWLLIRCVKAKEARERGKQPMMPSQEPIENQDE